MFRSGRSLAFLVLLPVLVLGLAACSDDGSDETSPAPSSGSDNDVAEAPVPGVASASLARTEDRIVVDVRTPEEFDEAHVDGAVLIDIRDPSFDGQIADLDADAEYVVYCRSGNRSAQAAERMRSVGLDVLDGGGLEDMVEAGWPST